MLSIPRLLKAAVATLLAALPQTASAQYVPTKVVVSTGVTTTIPALIMGLVNVMLMWSSFITLAVFLVGAFIMVISGGEEKFMSKGKSVMKGALIGYAFVLASWMIISTVVFFIAG